MEDKKRFSLEIKMSDDRIYKFTGPGGPQALDLEDTKETEVVLYNLLKHIITVNWRKDIIAKETEAKKDDTSVDDTNVDDTSVEDSKAKDTSIEENK